jgi:hypothetical protein
MSKKVTLPVTIVVLFSFANQSFAQSKSQEEKAVIEIIHSLFTGMQKADSAMAHATFTKDVTTATIFQAKNGDVVLEQENSVADFMKAVGTPHPDIWHEEIWNLNVRIDGDFAQAWCDYAFYAGNVFSHCGVDAFHLCKTKHGWKIFHLADTRRKSDCVIPQDIQDKHK